MVATLALGASAERRGGSSPSIRTKFWKCGRVRFIATVLKTVVPQGTVSSNLTASASSL
jgi:hypothetical protein